jgi:hypothetical protein
LSASLYGDNTIAKLRSLVKDAIAEELGVFQTGEDAIWVTPPVTPEFGSGLHCIIDRNAQRLGEGSRYQWLVSLVFVPTHGVVDEANYLKFDNALNKMRDRFPIAKEVHQKYRGFYQQITFFLMYEREAFR